MLTRIIDFGLMVTPYMDIFALSAAVGNYWLLRPYMRIIPGLRFLLIGLVCMTAWLTVFDIISPKPLITGPTILAQVRFVGNRLIFMPMQVAFLITILSQRHRGR